MITLRFRAQRLGLAAFLLFTSSLLSAADLTVSGVGNFHQVNDHVYRGAQPTDEGFQALAKLGIKTVVDLREPGSRSTREEKVVTAAGMRYVTVPMQGMSAPAAGDVAKVLGILDDSAAGPVFVHCRRGADRTGTVMACYRIAHDRWENQKALAEARSLGMSWVERAMQGFVRNYAPAAAAATATAVGAPAVVAAQ